jgi:DNA polymerase III alpha subunit
VIATGFSFRHAVGSVSDVVSRLKELGWTAAPIADRSSTFGHVKWDKLAREAGLRPIFGVSLGVTPQLGDRKPIVDWWKFLAIDSVELLYDAVYAATSRSAPYLTYEEAQSLPGLVKVAGSRCLLDEADELAEELYLGLSPSTPRGLYVEAKRRGFNFLADFDNAWPRPEDEAMYHAVLGSRRAEARNYPRHVSTDDELRQAVAFASDEDFEAALKNRESAFDLCRACLVPARMVEPERPASLRDMCLAGAAAKGVDLGDPAYADRLDRELRVIKEKGFEDYFYVVADVMKWARARMMCGPGRGSSSGSLMCWLLDVTAVDPIKFDLVFERFIDLTRKDLPDIDVDISDEKRDEVFDYLKAKYGFDSVARLANVITFASKSALNQVGAAIGVPKWLIEEAAAGVVVRSGGDSRADYTIEDTFKYTSAGKKLLAEYPEMALAGRIESHPTTSGQHSAGVVITAGSVRRTVGVNGKTGVAMVDWRDAKLVNLLKVDILGLTQLSILERCLATAKISGRASEFLEALPLDDAGAYAVLNKKYLAGIFQFQEATTRQVVHQLGKIESFEDIVSIGALCRPGPLGSGGTQSWINRRNGVEAKEVVHPAFWPYLDKTLGVMVYQEQIMRICRDIGDMSWEAITTLRGAMGKSLGMEFFDRYRDQFMPGALAKGIPAEAALEMWDKMCTFGMYGFNRAHSVAYGMITYWCCWLKAHCQLEFAAATLDAEVDPGKQIDILRELKKEGVDYVPVDPTLSTDRWTVREVGGSKVLIGPITNVKGIGPAKMREILDARRGVKSLKPGLAALMAAGMKTDLDSLYPVKEALDRVWADFKLGRVVPTPAEDVFVKKKGRRAVIAGVLVKNHPLNENEPSRVARRGYAVSGPTEGINFHIHDDSGEVFCKLDRWKFGKASPDSADKKTFGGVLLEANEGSSMFAVLGFVPADFRMLWVERIKYLGEMNGDARAADEPGRGRSGHQPDLHQDPGAEQGQGGGVRQRL